VDELVAPAGPALNVTCPTRSLAPGATLTCTAAGPYVVKQADVDRGRVESRAVASGQGPTPAGGTTPERTVSEGSSSGTVTIAHTPGLSVVKSATPARVSRAGESASYSFVVTNTGNVTMSDIRVVHELVAPAGPASAVVCPAAGQPLAPGATLRCTTAPHAVRQADVDRGRVVGHTVASGQAPTVGGVAPERTVSERSSSGTVTAARAPGLSVVKSATPTRVSRAGDRVSYSFVVTNTGNVTMSDIRVVDDLVAPAGLACSAASQTLAPGDTLTCAAGQYVVTQADVRRGRIAGTTKVSGQPVTPADGAVPSRTVAEPSSADTGVVEVIVPKSAASGLARTGVSPLIPFGGAGVLMLLGGVILLIARRRQAASAPHTTT